MEALLNQVSHESATYHFSRCSLKVLLIKEQSRVVMFQSTPFVIKDCSLCA